MHTDRSFEESLRALTPAPLACAREQIFFRAGQESLRGTLARWRRATALLSLALLGVSLPWLLAAPPTQVIVVQAPAVLPRPTPAVPRVEPPPAPEPPYVSPRAALLAATAAAPPTPTTSQVSEPMLRAGDLRQFQALLE